MEEIYRLVAHSLVLSVIGLKGDIIANNTDRITIEESNSAVLERVYRRYPALLGSLGIAIIVPIITLLLRLDEWIGFYMAEASAIAAFVIGLDTTIKVKRILQSE